MTSRNDDISDECDEQQHAGCIGYTGDESDPGMCECPCHDDLARHLAGQPVDNTDTERR